MKLLYNWLKEFISFSYSPEELAEKLLSVGIEVESVEEAGVKGVKIAEVVKVSPHPQADRLKVCQVFTGKETLQVICGAPNVREGIKAPLILPGFALPDGTSIRKVKIRGVVSEGMLCSEKELGVGEDASGIWILPSHLKTGGDLFQELSLNEWIIEITLTPNRGDCLSHLGIAREISALTGERIKFPETDFSEENKSHEVEVEVREPQLCPRYTLRVIEDVKVGVSPLWMRRRLELAGFRPINNVVDITNYVMLEVGQPLHAFDASKIEGSKIVVRRASEGESLVTLEGEEKKLTPENLIIADIKKPVAIGGVIGGENSGIDENTSTVLLESAYFNPSSIRKTSRLLGIVTESSYRFEREVDFQGVEFASRRATYLLQKIGKGKVLRGFIDKKEKREKKTVFLYPSNIPRILGREIPEFKEILTRLGFGIERKGKALKVEVPSYRNDVQEEIDLIEEIARIYGYDNFPSTLPRGSMPPYQREEKEFWIRRVRENLLRMGLWEVVNYSFLSPETLNKALLPLPSNALRVTNPLSEEWEILRFSLLPGLLEVAERNFSRGEENLKIFEIGKVFFAEKGDKVESYRVAGLISGVWEDGGWISSPIPSHLSHVKGIIEEILKEERVEEREYEEKGDSPLFSHSLTLTIKDEKVGILGEVSSEVKENFSLKGNVFLWEVDLDKLFQVEKKPKIYEEPPRFPGVKRDISLLVREGVKNKEIEEVLREVGGELLKEVRLFDIYRGKPIPPGFKSLAYSLTFRSEKKTLKEKEVEKVMERIIHALEEKGVKVRKK